MLKVDTNNSIIQCCCHSHKVTWHICLGAAVEAAGPTGALLDLLDVCSGGQTPQATEAHASSTEPDPVNSDHHLGGRHLPLLQGKIVRRSLDTVR